MNKLVSQLIIGNDYLEIEYKDKVLILSSDSGMSIVLNDEELDCFRTIREMSNDKRKMSEYFVNNSRAYKLVLRLIENGIIWIREMKEATDVETRRLSAYWGLTDNCNFRCAYCYANAGEIQSKLETEHILTFDESYRIVDEVVRLGFRELVLTGGEPLLNKDVFAIANYAKEKGIAVGLLTNGSLICKYEVEKFLVFDYVKISIDSYDEETNDKLRGKGSFEKIISGMRMLIDNGVNVTTGTVLTKYNCEQLQETIEYINGEFGITDQQIINHIPLGRGANSELGCDFDKLKECDDVILRTKSNLYGEKLFSIIQDGFVINGRKISCGMGKSEIFINSKGNVYPCRMTYSDEFLLGNILDDNLDIILSRVNKITSKLHVDKLEGCKDCTYRYVCGGGCRMYHCGFSNSIYENNADVCEAIKRQCTNLILIRHGIDPIN